MIFQPHSSSDESKVISTLRCTLTMEATIAICFSSTIPFFGCLFRRLTKNHSSYNNDQKQSQCSIPSQLVKYLAFGSIGHERLFLQIIILTLHTTNALLLMMLLKKILGRRRIHDEHICICSYVAVAAIFAAHSTRTALLNDVDSDLSLLFLIAVVVSLSGIYLTMNTNGHFQPSVLSSVLLVVGIVFVIITLFFGGEIGLMMSLPSFSSSSSSLIDSSSTISNNNNAKYYIFGAMETSPLPSQSILSSPFRLITSTQWVPPGLFSTCVDFVRNTILQPPTAMGTLKMLQSVLNIINAQLFLPVNVDNGYVQTQREALGLLRGTQSQSLGMCRSGSSSDESKVISTLRCAASVVSRLSTDYAPVVELTAVIMLVGFVLFRCAQQQLRSIRQHSQLTLFRHMNPFGITSIVFVSILCCLNVCFTSNSNSSKDSEMLVLSRQSYIPSAFMSVCLGELMVLCSCVIVDCLIDSSSFCRLVLP